MKCIRVLSLVCTVFLGACASMGPKLQSPQISLVSATMTSADIFSQQFRVRVHVDNPNNRALPIKTIDYKLFLENDSFAEGVSEAPFVVPANGMQEFDLTLRTNFVSSIGRLLSRLNGTGSSVIQYKFAGHVVVDATFSPKLNFGASGTVDLGRK